MISWLEGVYSSISVWVERIPPLYVVWRIVVRAVVLFWQFCLLCTDLTNEFLSKNGAQLAAAISYYSLLSLIPLTLILASFLGFLAAGSVQTQEHVVAILSNLLPVSQDYVAATLGSVVRTRTVVGVLGLVGLLWPSTAVFGIIRKTVNFMWGGTRPRPFLQERLIDITLTIFGGLLIVIPIGLTILYGFTGEAIHSAFPDIVLIPADVLLRLALPYISPVVSLMVFLLLYRYLPNTRVTFREIWPGTVLVTMAFEANKWWFFWYARSFPITDTVYGTVGGLIVLLGWIWVSADILLYGAMATARVSPTMSRKIEGFGIFLWKGILSFKSLFSRRRRIEGGVLEDDSLKDPLREEKP